MNPWDLDATGLMIWGLVAHLIADWLLQNEYMALNKMKRREHSVTCWPPEAADWHDETGQGYIVERRWWDRHPAAYVHAGIHAVALALVFGWVAVPLAAAHLFIDLRFPVAWWSRLVRQTQPSGEGFDIGADVRIWTDQVFHIACIAIAALVVGGLL